MKETKELLKEAQRFLDVDDPDRSIGFSLLAVARELMIMNQRAKKTEVEDKLLFKYTTREEYKELNKEFEGLVKELEKERTEKTQPRQLEFKWDKE